MGQLRVAYITDDLLHPSKDYKRDIEFFPLKSGKYRLKKHPTFSFVVESFAHNTLTFKFKGETHTLLVNQYTYFTIKQTSSKKIDVFFEIMDEEWVDEKDESDKNGELSADAITEIPDKVLKIHYEDTEIDSYSRNDSEKDFELPAVVGANIEILSVNGILKVEKIYSEESVQLTISGHYGKEIIVTSDEPGIYDVGDTYGYNDNFRSFSCKMTIQLVKK